MKVTKTVKAIGLTIAFVIVVALLVSAIWKSISYISLRTGKSMDDVSTIGFGLFLGIGVVLVVFIIIYDSLK